MSAARVFLVLAVLAFALCLVLAILAIWQVSWQWFATAVLAGIVGLALLGVWGGRS